MFARASALALLALAALASAHRQQARAPSNITLGALGRRTMAGQSVAFACYGGGGDCECAPDNNGDGGVLINVYPGYQCAYPGGACTWDDKVPLPFSLFSPPKLVSVCFQR